MCLLSNTGNTWGGGKHQGYLATMTSYPATMGKLEGKTALPHTAISRVDTHNRRVLAVRRSTSRVTRCRWVQFVRHFPKDLPTLVSTVALLCLVFEAVAMITLPYVMSVVKNGIWFGHHGEMKVVQALPALILNKDKKSS